MVGHDDCYRWSTRNHYLLAVALTTSRMIREGMLPVGGTNTLTPTSE